jgi:pSer/pThr/pTyr-binding forkhead associated (FHA) protein
MSTHEPDRDHEPPAPATFLESFDNWAQLLRHADAGYTTGPETQPPSVTSRPAPPAAHPAWPDAPPYRPTIRKPMALLQVVDDGGDGGEVIRVRGDEIVIGRSEGDVVIPHDISMATRHARITRLPEGGWQLSDLESGSDRGTFVRAVTAKLKDGKVLQLGSTRFRFEVVDLTEARLVELAPGGVARHHECHGPAATIGRSGCGCTISIDDPFVSPLHAEVRAKASGWKIENRGLNGLWVKIEAPVKLLVPSQFQCGEQRFVFVPLG